MYFKINPTTYEIMEVLHGDYVEYNTQFSAQTNGKPYLVEVVITVPAFDEATEYLSAPIDSYNEVTNTATRTYTVITKTQGELDAEALQEDIALISDKGKDVILVLVQFVDWALENTAMSPTDFDPKVKDAFLEIKAIADRIIASQ